MQKINIELKDLKENIKGLDARLSFIEKNIKEVRGAVGSLQEAVTDIQQRVDGVGKKVGGVEQVIKDFDEDINDIGRNFEDLEGIVENLDNSQRKNNIKIQDLREGEEGKDLTSYLTKVFATCLGSESEVEVAGYCWGLSGGSTQGDPEVPKGHHWLIVIVGT